jgi:hypothetical protein
MALIKSRPSDRGLRSAHRGSGSWRLSEELTAIRASPSKEESAANLD